MNSEVFKNEFGHIYDYTSPPIMPGIRHLYGVPEEHHKLIVNLDAEEDNFIPSNHPAYNKSKYGKPTNVMSAGGCGIEAFGHARRICLFRLLIFILIVLLMVYYFKNN